MRQQIIDRALGEGAAGATDAGAVAAATVRAVGLLLAELKPLVGGLAASALYGRSLHLAKTSVPRPSSIDGVDFEAQLAALHENLASRDAAEARRVSRSIIDCLVDVLSSLIGTPLTHRMLRTAWDIPVDDLPSEEYRE